MRETVILVTGALDDGTENEPLAAALSEPFDVINHGRRGRDGAEPGPCTLEDEIADVAELVERAGARAHAYGVSSGGALLLEAAAAGVPIARLAVYEVPYQVGEDSLRRWHDYLDALGPALAERRHGDAIELFMRMAGSSEEGIDSARSSAVWARLEALAPSLEHDAACLGDGRPPVDRLRTIRQPTLVATGAAASRHTSGLPHDFFEQAADAIAACVPNAERRTLEEQSHTPEARVLAPLLERFFGARRG